MANKLNEQGLKLSTEQGLKLGLSAYNDFYSLAVSLSGGKTNANSYKFQAWQNKVNAELLRMDAEDIIREGNDYENQMREAGLKTRGQQIAEMSSSGFDVGSASYKGIVAETDYNIQKNVAAIRAQTMKRYASTIAQADIDMIQANYYDKAARLVKKQSKTSGLISGLLGLAKVGGVGLFGSSTGIQTGIANDALQNLLSGE